jgi:hypothetical protein
MERVLKKVVRNDREFVSTYLALLNGLLKLTPSEMRVLTEFVLAHYQMKLEGFSYEDIGEILFSSEYREVIRERLSKEDKPMSKASLTGFLKILIAKNLIKNTTYGFDVDRKLLPVKKLTFEYIVNYE